MEVDTTQSRFASLDEVENSIRYSDTPTVYSESDDDVRCGLKIIEAFKVLEWIRAGNTADAIAVRVQAAFYYFGGGSKQGKKTQSQLGRELGFTKAAICDRVNEFRDFIAKLSGSPSTIERVSLAAGMRSEGARKTFSKVCKSNHQKRKALSDSTGSQRTSTPNSPKQSDLRAKVLATAGLQ